MNFDEYQDKAIETAIYPKEIPTKLGGIVYTVLGLVNEAGEAAGKLKKIIRDHGGVMTPELETGLSKEIGDALWYAGAAAKELNIKLGAIAQENIDKLNDRKTRGVLGGSGDNR
jgi:NTP pyrophosphatase (non-canonical NTP hydrolase)